MKEKYRIKMIALCGIFSAAELVILYLSSVFQVLDLAIVFFTVIFTVVLMVEYSKKPSFAVYAVVAVLSLLIVPHKFSPLCYVFFMGFYPIIKSYFDDCPKVLGYILKLLYFNGAYYVIYAIVSYFALLDDIFGIGTPMFFVTLAITNISFLLCDYVISVMTALYIKVLRKKFGFERIFKK
ncbi:MAG: hypothetical protein J5879_05280 [Clostridia bacterium]|nr:hypothetical protein [Clostridia bacterium]